MNAKSLLLSKSAAIVRSFKRPFLPLLNYLPSGKQLCDFDGFRLMLDFSKPGHQFIYKQGGFETELTTVLAKMFRPGETFVDIGANIGWHTLSILSKHSDLGIVYAFEPSREMCLLLNQSIIANNYQNKCVIKQLALSDRKGMTCLKTFVGLDPMHASLYPLADYPYEEEKVEVDTLDSQAMSFALPISVIKCDVEGAERDILLGAKRILSGRFGEPPIWFIEANYETAGMANFFPWQLIEIAAQCAPYQGFYIRNGRIISLPFRNALRHGDTLILAIPNLHKKRLELLA